MVLETIQLMKHRRPKCNRLQNNRHPNDPVDSNGVLIENTMDLSFCYYIFLLYKYPYEYYHYYLTNRNTNSIGSYRENTRFID